MSLTSLFDYACRFLTLAEPLSANKRKCHYDGVTRTFEEKKTKTKFQIKFNTKLNFDNAYREQNNNSNKRAAQVKIRRGIRVIRIELNIWGRRFLCSLSIVRTIRLYALHFIAPALTRRLCVYVYMSIWVCV